MKFERKKRPFRQLGRVINIINIVLSAAVITGAVMIGVDSLRYRYMFPVVFFSAACINLALGIKAYKRSETVKFAGMMLAFGMLIMIGVLSVIVVVNGNL